MKRSRPAGWWRDDEYHAAGDRKDVYEHFQRLDRNLRLAPTTDDFENLLSETPGTLIDALRGLAPQLLGEARAFPGEEVRKDFVASVQPGDVGTAIMTVDIVCETDGDLEEGWLGLVIPTRRDVAGRGRSRARSSSRASRGTCARPALERHHRPKATLAQRDRVHLVAADSLGALDVAEPSDLSAGDVKDRTT
jgi:hypothetical protein